MLRQPVRSSQSRRPVSPDPGHVRSSAEDDRIAWLAGLSTSSRRKVTLSVVYLALACSKASGVLRRRRSRSPRRRRYRECPSRNFRRRPGRRPSGPGPPAIHRRRPGAAGTSSSPPARPAGVRSPGQFGPALLRAGCSGCTCQSRGNRFFPIFLRHARFPDRNAGTHQDVNTRYHTRRLDSTTPSGIDFGDIPGGTRSPLKLKALGECRDARGHPRRRRHRVLLAQPGDPGTDRALTATDISPGMLKSLARTAGPELPRSNHRGHRPEVCPLRGRSFDTVIGHAVLHHIPTSTKPSQFFRVLRPLGGGSSSAASFRYGDRLAAVPKQTGNLVAPAWRKLVGADTLEHTEEEKPTMNTVSSRGRCSRAFVPVSRPAGDPAEVRFRRDQGERRELVANVWGWGCVRWNPPPRLIRSRCAGETSLNFRELHRLPKVDNNLLEPPPPGRALHNLRVGAQTRLAGRSTASRGRILPSLHEVPHV